ncbi:MAG TPA: amino acid racemase [Parafilimonas sp.]|nr:amino acid racemase [Parafilimonas sp.]
MTNSENNNGQTMKTIGILGGLGPQATMDIEMRLHNVAQQMIPQEKNSGYPLMAVQYYRHAPVLLADENTPVVPFQPDPRLLKVAENLGAIADFLLIASNGVHLLQREIEEASGRKVLSMIDATLEEVKAKGWQKVGVLGLMNSMVYTIPMNKMGIAYETIDNELQRKLNQAIFKVMEGHEDDSDRAIAIEAINQLRSKNVDGIIPGCTEVPLLLRENMNAPDILNPAQLVAEAAIKFSLS